MAVLKTQAYSSVFGLPHKFPSRSHSLRERYLRCLVSLVLLSVSTIVSLLALSWFGEVQRVCFILLGTTSQLEPLF